MVSAMERGGLWLTALGMALVSVAATVVLIVWVTRLSSDNDALKRDVATLQGELDATSAKIATSSQGEVAAQAAEFTALKARVQRAQNRLAHIRFCLPELRTEEQSVRFQSYQTGGYVTGGFLSHGSPISRFCSDLFLETNLPTR